MGPGPDPGPRTRAQGLTRAVLDSFPLIKFGQSDNHNNASQQRPNRMPYPKFDDEDMERHGDGETTYDERIAMQTRSDTTEGNSERRGASHAESSSSGDVDLSASTNHPAQVHDLERNSRQEHEDEELEQHSPHPEELESVDPATIGHATCPICIVDFENGDDVRVLPCEGKHRFHQECVDPWLLELSTSCPICRAGKQLKLTASDGRMIMLPVDFDIPGTGVPTDSSPSDMPEAIPPLSHTLEASPHAMTAISSQQRLSASAARFSKHLRFMRRNRTGLVMDGRGGSETPGTVTPDRLPTPSS